MSPKEIEHQISFQLVPSYRRVPRRPLPSSGSTSIPLPLEVVLCIIEAAFYENNEPDEDLLRSCALVCRAWSGLAQKLLFSRVTLRTQSACESFSGAITRSTERGRALGDAVIRLRVVIDHNQPYGLSQQSFGRAFTLCPNLYELSIALYGCAAPGDDIVGVSDVTRLRRPAPSFDNQILALLKSGPAITALQISNWSENRHTVAQLLDLWPTLKSLSISGTPPQALPDSPEPFPCALNELRMNFQSPPSIDFMNWLLHNSRDTLRILDLEREPSTQLFDYLIDSHGHMLHSLSLPSMNDHTRALMKCDQLKELRIETPVISGKLYKELPDTLEHLAFGLDRNTVLQPALEALRSHGSLTSVTVNVWNGGGLHPQFSAFKIACAYQGIGLRVTNEVQTFRAMTRGDPIPCQFFPRMTSLDNLRMMRS
ncbi:hypothetical protein BDZ94DRAFT_1151514 [Collybia nuda]|uniref:F-box domain-containing protein n=1 Tax=Collybia nuda TaxID=64659 RepID=A0A9P6CR08_9AGAR|nr:hypothetical protein BDZ94DRAFT_1151514 [Collybia nuda]